jgi:hypothetical protein
MAFLFLSDVWLVLSSDHVDPLLEWMSSCWNFAGLGLTLGSCTGSEFGIWVVERRYEMLAYRLRNGFFTTSRNWRGPSWSFDPIWAWILVAFAEERGGMSLGLRLRELCWRSINRSSPEWHFGADRTIWFWWTCQLLMKFVKNCRINGKHPLHFICLCFFPPFIYFQLYGQASFSFN